MRISEHFTLEELTASATAKARGIGNAPSITDLANLNLLCKHVLEPIRVGIGKPMIITSAFRSPELEKAITGITTKDRSQHMTGLAADFVIPGMAVKDIFLWILNDHIPYDQLIYEKNSKGSEWIHVSYGTRRMALLGIDSNSDTVMEYIHVNKETYTG